MLKVLINKIKFGKECFNAGFKIGAEMIDVSKLEVLNQNYKGYKIIKFEEGVRYNNCILAVVNLEQKIIMVDNYFMKLSDNCKKFIIEHEIGHSYIAPSKLKAKHRFLENEIEADRHAILSIGKENSIEAIKEIIRLRNNILGHDNELNKRLNAIESY